MILAFGDCEIDRDLYEIRRGGAAVRVEPKVFDVLLYLVEHRERVVAKDELLDRLWPGEHVSDSVLPRCITAARKALGDDADRQAVIQTVHGRGYRFVAPLSGAAAGAPAAAPAAPPADDDAAAPFVGREAVMTALHEALAHARAGRARLVLLVGEPGIGKTRTAEELAREARRQGARVLTGRCWEGEGAPAFWAWVQILRAWLARADAARTNVDAGAALADLLPVLPELRTHWPSVSLPPPLEPEQARFRLFDGVARVLAAASARQPLALILDDLHWADTPSLLLLRFLAQTLRQQAILIVGTYRDVALRRDHPLAAMLGELAREPIYARLPLRGLGAADVAHVIARIGGREPPPALTAAVVEMTDGNPFFVTEIARLLAAEGRFDLGALGTGLPEGIREAIGRRLSALSADANAVLAVASVIGRTFTLPVLTPAVDLPRDRVLEVLDEAAAARIVVAEGPARHRFVHTLIRETLYEELATVERVRLHRRIGAILEQVHAADVAAHQDEIAHHYFQGAAGGEAEKAVAHGIAAGERALGLLAYEEAAGHFGRALQALAVDDAPSDPRAAELLLRLGDAQSRSGDREAARRTFARAADAARALGRADLLGRAALGFGGRAELGMPRDDALLALLDDALAALPPDATALRARLLARLAGSNPHAESVETRRQLTEEAMGLARRAGDPETLALALAARRWALLGPDHVEERLAIGTELLALAAESGNPSWAWLAHECRFDAHMAVGDMEGADRELDALGGIAAALRLPVERWFVCWFRASRALNDGRFDEAERLADEALALGRRAQHPGAALLWTGQSLYLAHERGRPLEFERGLEVYLQHFGWADRLVHVGRALVSAQLGQLEEARAELDALGKNAFRDLPRDEHWLTTLGQLAGVCADVGDRRHAAALYELLASYAGRPVVHASLRVSAGAVDLYLGQLAMLLDDLPGAAHHLAAAQALHRRMGAEPFVIRTELVEARLLLLRGGAADRRRAATLIERGTAAAERLGMVRVAAGGRQLRAALDAAPPPPVQPRRAPAKGRAQSPLKKSSRSRQDRKPRSR